MIVKVQVSLASSYDKKRVLIYNEDRTVEYEQEADQAILDIMDGAPKKYFNAHMEKTLLVIDEEVDPQSW